MGTDKDADRGRICALSSAEKKILRDGDRDMETKAETYFHFVFVRGARRGQRYHKRYRDRDFSTKREKSFNRNHFILYFILLRSFLFLFCVVVEPPSYSIPLQVLIYPHLYVI